MACVSDNEVVALVEGLVPAARRAELLAEIAQCSSCRSLVHDCLVASAGGDAETERSARDGDVSAALPAEIAGYRLGDVLGAGSGGVVVRARDPVLDRDVALKLVRTTGDGDPAAHALREARTLATLRHPAVVAVYATGASEHLGYVAMELVDGENLADRIARGPLPWREVCALFAEVAGGLAAIHATGLVHRDLKPGNLLVDGGRLRIADFGLASRAPSATLAGTLPYLAPEVLGGAAADTRSDVYALFASAYEAMCGVRPYRELDRRALQAAAEHGELDWPAAIPNRVRRVIARGLDPKPARRPDVNAARLELQGLVRTPITRWVALGVAVAAIGIVVGIASRPGPATCSVTAPAWSARTAEPQLSSELASYEQELADAHVVACSAGPPQRTCLARLEQHVDALLASGGSTPDLERAILGLPAPETCATWLQSDAALPIETVALAAARSALDLGQPKAARARLIAIAPGSALEADADVIRGRAALGLDDKGAAATAFRAALDHARGRDDLVIAANLGLARALGDEAYATTARTLATRLNDRRSVIVARRAIASLTTDPARAETELRAAMAEAAPHFPLELANCQLQLATIDRKRGAYATARAEVEEAFEIRRRALGADHPETIRIEEERAKIDGLDGHADRANAAMQSEVARLEKIYGATSEQLAEPLTTLGAAQFARGDYPSAERSLTRALALYRASRGELDLDVAHAYSNVAGLRMVQGKYPEAADLYRAALASERSVLGDDQPELAVNYGGLGVALASAGRYRDARDADDHAIAIYKAHPGRDQSLADALAKRAVIELGLDHPDLDAARNDGEQALAILARLHGDTHVALAPALMGLAQVELAAKNYGAARGYIERVLAIHAHARPRQIAEEQLIAAQIAWRQHEPARARSIASSALAALGTDDPQLAERVRAWLRAPS